MGKNANKRLKATLEAEVDVMDQHSRLLLVEIERGDRSAVDVAEEATKSTPAEAARLMLNLKRVQSYLLDQYKHTLTKAASKLNTEGCWQFLKAHNDIAERAGITEDLTSLVFACAANFADPRMAKLTRKYKGK